ncbi:MULTISPECIES: hydroxyacylglutathione hydrolase [unclassified Prochlorococcus]|uniref:hydroxyacylglutathione hydrolase n=1 Tax=unclassified Prochlorococcus TaxID=2627481 RepID=UPI000533AA1C|nr:MULTISPECIES: hydroxyacylglutathione hydrolase [unclassified Prochlorococcus]KGG16399.1 Hydroxyacylglutathione hydrolase [Prochlorococcus sp. MIT 0602]KGG17126.1 Hydroxyacylglutathione hydrolase [Prochlorococcus sp. MIT 0603]
MKQEKNDFIIHPIPVLKDNIIWIWVKKNQAVVIDPAISEPVISWLQSKNLTLESILQTHHHDDHIGGTEGLLRVWPASSVIASKEDIARIPFQTRSVLDNETFSLLGEEITVLSVPGHTKHHISFYLHASKASGVKRNPVLFCGDTLFGAGCGRLFEGTAHQMFDSLKRINKLPANTKIYCAHEYTENNLIWAKSIYPEDIEIKRRLAEVISKRSKGLLSLPTTLYEERKSNLFIRSSTPKELSKLRLHKDSW